MLQDRMLCELVCITWLLAALIICATPDLIDTGPCVNESDNQPILAQITPNWISINIFSFKGDNFIL